MSAFFRWAGIAASVALAAGVAAADGFERVTPVRHAATQKECGECHMAFQPALLPAESWTRIMTGLGDHFGEDASLPEALASEIRAYLVANAGRGDPTVSRISDQPWWQREHRFSPSVWRQKEVGSKANCDACHRQAGQGLYDDD
jgi:nitrate/TMAO reductase-like tetraheme cytochrome c subunit